MKKQLPNLICTAGVAVFCAGLWQIYPPITWLVLGAFVCFIGVQLFSKQKPPPSSPKRRDLL